MNLKLQQKIIKALDRCLPQFSVPEKFTMLVDGLLYGASHGTIGEPSDAAFGPIMEMVGEGEWCDPLGDVYMGVVSSYKAAGMGQYFTPYPVCRMMANITLGTNPDTSRPLSFMEPTCGSGANIIALAEIVQDTRDKHLFLGSDLDLLCVKMATVQMALHSIPGAVFHMDTLTLEVFSGYVIELGRWGGGFFPRVREAVGEELEWYKVKAETQAAAPPKPKKPTRPEQGNLF